MEVTISMHRRSKSEFCMRRNEENKLNKILPSNFLTLGMGNLKYCVEANNRQLASTDVQNSLKEEILQLQRQLKKQFAVRYELEKEMSYRPLLQLHDPANDSLTNKPAKDLIKEIATLELEIVNLEKYLLSLYRKTFGKKLSSRSQLDERSKSTHEWMFSEVPGQDKKAKIENSVEKSVKECSENFRAETLVDSSILRSHSSLSQNSAYSFRICPPMGTVSEAVNSYHSSPLSMLECTRNTASSISLAEHLGNSIPDYVRETPNWISEEMIKCISAIYCQIAEPPLFNHGFNSSPISFSSAMSESSPRGQNITRNPHCRENSSSNSWFSNPSFHINCSKEFSGSYFGMTEVQSICRDSHRLTRVESQLQNFRSLVTRLEEIDPRKLKREEKLAFWINVHNALVMHTFLVYGVPQRNLKRISLLLKVECDAGCI